ncbi:uncharacterized protein EI90DRAFT_3120108 [Cantharellus anzutake]|uniref:uncharacterized protein n=1 Tax=Cantharellus anzutake TaxID=1750568 RepID=UPI001908167B|nr:uncharacterized protein EI90DRAFT_3120108 [Cantharellus anzutake]KAF8335857.1 hypothetical protein EI90DRAFT_3120108 [Cantharellus anzutake]
MFHRVTVTSSRTALALRRVAALRYIQEGAVGREGQSKGFSQREKSQEDKYVYEIEKRKLQEKIRKHQEELAELEKKAAEEKVKKN